MSELPTDPALIEQITTILAESYQFTDVTLERVPAGQVTINYRASSADGRTLFVKQYMVEADLTVEAQAIEQTRAAGEHAVPVATVISSTAGEVITSREDVALSLWEWVPGRTVEDGLTPVQQQATGRALGRIHTAFATHPVSADLSTKLQRWLRPDLDQLEATVDTLLDVIADRPEAEQDAFDDHARRTLTERRTMLHQVPELLAGLPELTCQVLHGDYSAVNLLFDTDQLTAVLDFRPPQSYSIAWELGRIAFDPRAVVLDDDWITSGTRLVAAYLEQNPSLPVSDVRACARVALTQLVTSLYGVKQHYLKPGLLQDNLDAFWALRHQAAGRLLDHLGDIEDALAATA